jgi:hypothetical protein
MEIAKENSWDKNTRRHAAFAMILDFSKIANAG